MQFFEKPEDEILEVANSIWDNLIEGSNEMDYEKISKHFSKNMLKRLDEANLKKQWETNEVLTSLSSRREYLGCLRRGSVVTVLWNQLSFKIQGDHLAKLMLKTEKGEVKICSATIT